MIPLTLRVHNFMCYRDNVPPLDLRGIHLACLAGDNGHGKSALLDAMTWALWGKARVSRDDLLIHRDRTEMEVELEFDLGAHRYRVIRKRDSRRGQSVLELQGWAEDRYLPLSEPTIRQTQAKIIDLLRMDYETFINSAFLVQGRADEFTTKTAGERKRILGEILGLGKYDEYVERAKERAKQREQEAADLAAQIREIDRELEQLPAYEAQLQEAGTEAAELARQLDDHEAEQKRLQISQKTLLLQQQQLDELKARLDQGERDLAEIAVQLGVAEREVASFVETLGRQEEIAEGYDNLQSVREAVESWNQRLAAQGPLVQEQHQLNTAIGEARGQLLIEQKAAETRAAALRERVQAGEKQREELAAAQIALADLAEQQVRQESLREELALLSEERAALRAQNPQLHQEMDDLKERIELLREGGEATCPLCQQPLDDSHRRQLLSELSADGKAKGDQYRANGERDQYLETQVSDLQRQIDAVVRVLRALPAQQGRSARAQAMVTEGEGAATELVNIEASVASLQARLVAMEFAPAEQQRLAKVVAEFERLGYDGDAHQTARDQLAGLAGWEEQHRQLERAVESVEDKRERVADLQKRQTRWQETRSAEEASRDELEEAVSRLPQISDQLRDAERQVEVVREQERNARLRLGAARQRVATGQRLAKDREIKQAAQKEAAEAGAIYRELSEAFGRRGLQAMIIEAAIPEIEHEANGLLGRMTEGRMSVRLDTQRETLAGETRETLDIIISDELGARNYGLFSGGEAFRINFALRIAISKLLARRAGTQLRTLFIDEGFGTQDAHGRERLVEAIKSIMPDFDRILVITHIEELKDMFPVRIDVVKTDDGSQVSLG